MIPFKYFAGGCLIVSLLAGDTLRGQEDASDASSASPSLQRPGAVALERFALIFDRNIFDPNRRGPEPERTFTPPPAPDPVYTLKYFGLMRYGDKELAFFGGDGVQNAGAKALGETVDAFEVVALTADVVSLRRADEERVIEVPVGGGFRKQGDAAWEFVATLASSGSAGGTRFGSGESGEASGAESSASAPADDDAQAALLRAMMERRRSE